MKLKILLTTLIYMVVCQSIKSQITIGLGAEPDNSVLLDIKTNTDGTSNKGVLLPRVSLTDTNTFGLNDNSRTAGILIYNNNGAVTGANARGIGYYYWDGSSWNALGIGTDTPWINGGNSNTSIQTLGTTTNLDLPIVTNNTEKMRITSDGNVGIGTLGAPNSSAILQLNTTDKAFYLPRVQLLAANDVTTVSSPQAGMIVFNTNTTMGVGLYIYDGNNWVQAAAPTPPTRMPYMVLSYKYTAPPTAPYTKIPTVSALQFDTKILDEDCPGVGGLPCANSAYNQTTGIYTVKTRGLYQFQFSSGISTLSSGNVTIFRIVKKVPLAISPYSKTTIVAYGSTYSTQLNPPDGTSLTGYYISGGTVSYTDYVEAGDQIWTNIGGVTGNVYGDMTSFSVYKYR